MTKCDEDGNLRWTYSAIQWCNTNNYYSACPNKTVYITNTYTRNTTEYSVKDGETLILNFSMENILIGHCNFVERLNGYYYPAPPYFKEYHLDPQTNKKQTDPNAYGLCIL